MSRTAEQTAELLNAARAELEELLAEERRIGRDLDAARREDATARLEAARAGGEALSRRLAELRGEGA